MAGEWRENWQEVRVIGEGGQGRTYLVLSRTSGKEGVLKELKRANDPKALARMEREVATLKELKAEGAGVPSVIADVVKEGCSPYFVMEYIKGDTLSSLIARQGPLEVMDAVELCLVMCDTLEKALKIDVLHRDIKPENVIIRDLATRDVCFIDFGLSFKHGNDEGLTRINESFGNRFLLLPEYRVAHGDRRDSRSDITHLVGILFYCLTGNRPELLSGPDGKPPHMQKGRSVRERLGITRESSALERLFDRGFQSDIEGRFQHVAELRERLEFVKNPAERKSVDTLEAVVGRLGERLSRYDRDTQLDMQRPIAADIIIFIKQQVDRLSRGVMGEHLRLKFLRQGTVDARVGSSDVLGSCEVVVLAVRKVALGWFGTAYYVTSCGKEIAIRRGKIEGTSEISPFTAVGELELVDAFSEDEAYNTLGGKDVRAKSSRGGLGSFGEGVPVGGFGGRRGGNFGEIIREDPIMRQGDEALRCSSALRTAIERDLSEAVAELDRRISG